MIKSRSERAISESNLIEIYGDNGITFQRREDAHSHLRSKGFYISNEEYKNSKGGKAYLYKMRDIKIYNKRGDITKTVPAGYLVSFGGKPVSCYELKYTKIARPQEGS